MKTISLIFPNQLFEKNTFHTPENDVYLVEEFLFFRQYKFHKQKIAFHRASMKAYEQHLKSIGCRVVYIDSNSAFSDVRKFSEIVQNQEIKKINLYNPCDDWLERRILLLQKHCEIELFENPQFINTEKDLEHFFRKDKKFFFQTTFYKQERKRLGVLMNENKEPEGGKWTFDIENRKKYPKKKQPPKLKFPEELTYWKEAVEYTNQHFSDHYGLVSINRNYPVTHQEANEWLAQFLENRFYDFGIYEDAILAENSILNHSLISPLINSGLLLPKEVLDKITSFAKEAAIPINSTEGIVRQIIGWREFIRGMYVCKGRYSRTRNYWGFKRKIPSSFYNGTTGIVPVDETIKKVLETGYCNHIERLMILGNFMLLCEFDPDEVYKWFMELFIDAYDWVMVPNVYGMTLFADGGTFATKPYIGGSNYLKKMSNYPKGDWQVIWDGLFWKFVWNHQDFFKKNPRTNMLLHTLNKMSDEKKESLFEAADLFITEKLTEI
jgi:deoxyribodipyrimidine photolyase-related protein